MPEFTPELNEELLAALRRKIKDDEAQAIARAQGAAARRGLTGGSFEAVQTGLATQGAQRATADAMANLALEKAKMQREERLLGEERGYKTSERLGGEKFLTGERVGGELHRTGERLGGEKFSGAENLLVREAEKARLKSQQDWQTGESALGRMFEGTEREKARTFETEQNRLNREANLTQSEQERQARLELARRESEGRMLEEGVSSLGKGLGGLFGRRTPPGEQPGMIDNLKQFGSSLFPGGVKPGQTKIGSMAKSLFSKGGSKGLSIAKGLGSKLPGGGFMGGLGGLAAPAALISLWQSKKFRNKTKKLVGKGATSTLIKPLGQAAKNVKKVFKKLFRF